MTKSETLQQLAAASNAAHLDEPGQQIEALRLARIDSAEQLAAMLLPLAEAMATLTNQSRQTLNEIEQQGRDQVLRYKVQFEESAKALEKTVTLAQRAAKDMDTAANWTEWRHYLLAIAAGAMSGLLVSAFWLWLVPAIG